MLLKTSTIRCDNGFEFSLMVRLKIGS